MSFLVFGQTGWIGGMIIDLLQKQGKIVHGSSARLENRTDIEKEIDHYKPKYILNCAGVTGRPNVDWCEDHKQETIRANVLGAINLFDVAFQRGIHVTNFGTGCIYSYDEQHPIGGKGFTELDPPNFTGSFYSYTKGIVEQLLDSFPNVLMLRVRMPVSDDLHHRSLVTKITKYSKVVNVPNSITILTDMLPIAIDMTERELKGRYNFVNPGAISHNEILTLYKQYIDPNFTWQNFTVEEQDKILKAKRSNNCLDVSKLLQLYPNIKFVHESMVLLFQRMQENLKNNSK